MEGVDQRSGLFDEPMMDAPPFEPRYNDGYADELDLEMAAACQDGFEFEAMELEAFQT